MSPIKKSLLFFAIPICVALLLAACSGGGGGGGGGGGAVHNPDPGSSDSGHPSAWISNHGGEYLADPQACTECHGDDLLGGISRTSCSATTCHPGDDAPHMSPVLAADGSLHPDNTALTCGKCHDRNDFQNAVRYQCQRCHVDPSNPADPLNGILKTTYPDAYPYGFGSAPDAATHSSAVVGTAYGTWGAQCVTCHNPHAQEQDNAFGTSYGKLIKTLISFDNQATGDHIENSVQLTAPTGPGSFADGAPYSENICNTCHTRTNHQQNDGSAPGGQAHNDNLNCLACHAHEGGFAPSGGTPAGPHNTSPFLNNCDYCHLDIGMGVIDYVTKVPDSKCEQCHTPPGSLKGSFPTAPNVLTHSDIHGSGAYSYSNDCVDCHDPMFGQTNLANVRTTIAASVIAGSPINFTAQSGAGSLGNGAPYNENVCSTCHTMTNHHQSDGNAPGGQDHNNGSNCVSCHSHGDAFMPILTPPPGPHATAACTACHVTPDTYVADADIPNSACESCHDGSPATDVGTHAGSHYNDPVTGLPLNVKCVECHNPMADQTNVKGTTNAKYIRSQVRGTDVVYEGKTGNYGFAADATAVGDMNWENYLCNTCHTQTKFHQEDGTATLSQSHYDGEDCTICHSHMDGLTPISGSLPAPHNTVEFINNCGYCHPVDGSGVLDFVTSIPDAMCAQCHTPAGALKASFASAPDVVTHNTQACVECHDPMNPQTNIKLIRSTVSSSITAGSTILFTSPSGPGSFADGSPYNENLCNTCHSLTNHHQDDGTAPGGQSHNDGTNCMACHGHGGGFNPVIPIPPAPHNAQACDSCHVGTDYSAVIPDTKCAQCHTPAGALKGSYPTAPDVVAHSSKACVECHNPMSTQSNLKFVRSTIAGSIVPGSPITFTATSGAGSFADGVPYTENVCETCHSATDHHQSDGTAPGNQDHNDSTDCTACHTHGGGFVDHLASVSVPVPHDAAACTACHTTPDTYVVDAAIPDAACLTCHDGVTATLVATHSSKACVECHNPMSTQSNLKFVRSTIAGSIVPGSPITFTATSGADSFADGVPYTENVCETCHSATDHHQSDGTAPGNQAHNDSTDCTACHTHGGGFVDHLASVSVPAPHDAAACTACHTTPDTYVVDAAIPDAACLTCHDGVTATLVATHSSKACVECHNPMSTQTNLKFVRSTIAGSIVPGSPITFTATSGAGSFADGVPYTENVCETCHSATDHHQSDGTAPGNQDHNDSADCTACHTHGGGFVDHLASVSVPAPHDAAACTDCHTTPDTYVVDAAIPDAACLTCHDGVTATLVATHSSKACVECHNPMAVQTNLKFVRDTIAGSIVPGSPITFTATSGAGSFADGVPYTENVCETCHSATDHHQSDGTAPGNQDHNDSTDCTACHTHGGGFSDHLASVSVPAPHDAAACTDCHTTPDTYVVDAVIPDAACLACHDGVTAILVATHSSKACVECHNPMATQTNLKFVRSTIAGSIVPGSPITFTATSGAGSFADGVPYTENVCETCHSATDHHQSDGTAPGNQDHNDSSDCTACHTHGGGFVDHLASVSVPVPHDAAACTDCHTTPDTYVVDAAIPDAACLTCHDGVTATLVATHSSKACVECHNPMAVQTNLKFVRDTIAGSIVPGSPITFTATSGAGSFADGVPYTENVCETCHSATDHHQSDGTAPGNQDHNDSTDCTACHTHGGGFSDHLASVSVPAPHDAAACTDCHTTPDTYVVDAAIPDAACLACHDGVTATLVATHSSKACVECHNPMSTQSNLKFVRSTIAGSIVPGSPITFTATSGAGSFADGVPYTENVCETCHSATDHHQSDGTAPGNQDHNDSTDCTACHTHGGGFVDHLASVSVPAPHDAAACTACHTTPDTYVVDAAIPDAACLTCHDGVTATLVATHSSKACVECHNPMAVQTNLKFVRSTIAGSIVPGSPITFTATSGAGSFADGVPYTENVCETCHSATDHHQSDGTAPGNQDHNDSTDCTACHTHGGGFVDHLASVSVPAPHDAAACTACHTAPDTYVVDAAIPDTACLACHDGVTATLVATHSSKACVECHNPMAVQTNLKFVRSTIAGSIVPGSPITFTATSGAGSFADGVPYTENVCETCHSATDHHQSDGTAPGNQDHNDSTDCTACHTHGGGFVDHLASVSVPVPHDAAACTDCHTTPDTYVVDAAIPDAACLTCHDGVTATLVATHSSKACVECHNPMSTQSNFKFVRSTIAGSIVPGSPITFTATSGAGSFADGVPYTENVCETCHSATDHHQSDGTAPGNQAHNDSTDCTACHTHGGGFSDHLASVSVPVPHDAAACTDCHTTPDTYVVDAAIPDAACLACHDGVTATLVATHSSKACVECHNPMSTQSNFKFVRSTIAGSIVPGSPITFTATSGAGSFADGVPYTENVCETCHSATDHHQSDGTAPGNQAHNDSTDCTACHTHGGGFVDHLASVSVPAPHDAAACTACHTTPDTYVVDAAIPDTACLTCHDGVTATLVATHSSKACVECHNPMSTQTNLKFVRSTIAGSIVPGSPITFTATSGAGSFADGVPYTENVCETCHSATDHHQSDGTAPGNQDHNDSADCTACHTHGGGFVDHLASVSVPAPHDAAACTACHTTPDTYVVDAAIPDAACLTCHDGVTATLVATHSSKACVECHNPMSTQTNLKFVRSTIAGSIVPGSPITFTATSGAGSFADGVPYTENVCETCHSATDHHQSDGTAPGNQDHNDSTDCTACHTHGGGFVDHLASVSVPVPHDAAACTACHTTPDTYVVDAAIPDAACLTCHDGVTATLVATHSSKACVECHNPMSTQSNLKFVRSTIAGSIVPGSPITFTATSGADSFADGVPYTENVCETCHSATDHHQSDGTAPGNQAHNDSTDCTACHTHGGGFVDHLASVSVPAPHDAAACTACHTTPDTYVVDAAIPDAACLTCHDGVTATLVATHSSKACVECHNPMAVQTNLKFVRSTIAGSIVPGSPITFTATSGAGSFADGVPYTENVCETCHSATDHHQSDGTAPGNQDHNDSTDCTACHTHGGGFVDHLASVSVPVPHDAAACTACHTTPDTYVVDAAIPDAACLTCHDGVTATLVATHNTKTCVDCHNPMAAQTNLKFVRDTIGGSSITYTATSGAGSFADGAPHAENVCETCHTMTNHHQADGTAPGGQDHENSVDCRVCHAHGDGFTPAPANVPAPHNLVACGDCHGGADYSTPILDAACLACHDGVTATLVATHSSKACVECHNPMSTQTNLKFVRDTIAGSIVPGSPITFTATSGAGSFADGVPYTENVCETCHSATDHHQSDGTAPGNQDHNDSTDCTACHTHGGGFVDHLASVSVPVPHDAAACTDCHTTPDTYVVDAAIPDAACLTCHDGVTATLVATHSSKACVECHNPMSTQSNLKFVRSTIAGSIVPGSPITFTATSGAGSFADGVPYTENVCETCHSATDHHQSDGTAPGNQDHNDSSDCTACHTHGGGFVDHLASVSVPVPHDAAACTACHTTPDTYVVDAAIPDAACLTCHDGVTATLVATHSSKACVECHNPMAVQTNLKFVRDTIAGSIVPGSPITFTATSGAGSFADGVPYTENVCETCHSATDHHQSDGTAPGNQDHNDSTDCTACHTHGGGFVDHLASVSVPAPHDVAACTACHTTPDTYVVDAAIPDAACLTCHDGVTATLVATHSSKACVECHNPMAVQTNLKFVRSTIAGSIVPGSPITFTATSGAGSFADGVPYTENVCETCHSATDHHQSDGTAPGNQDHNDSTDCTACHTHGGGFVDHLASVSVPVPHDAAACTDCHTTPDTYVVDAAIPDTACLACHDGVTATLVATHSSKACVECHNPMSTQTNLKFVRSTIAGSIVPGSPITFTATSGAGSFADGVPYTENVCETCHSATDHHQSDGTAPGNQDHNDSTDCTACHTHGGGFVDHLASVSVPVPHDAAACTDCHTTPDTYVVDAAIPDAACLTCHDGVTATLVATHSSKACVECHNPMSTQSNLKFVRSTIAGSIVPGSPITFTATSGAGSFADGVPYTENVCETCHSATDHHQSDGTAPGNQDHNDSTDCTACHTHGGGFSDHLASVSVPAPHDAAACTDCHTTPDTYVVDAAIPDAACLTCHDGVTATLVATHSSKACVECHNPMSTQSNLKFVRSTIAGSIVPGSPITFTATSGADSFADGVPYTENVCETCHSATDHHQSDGTAPGNQDHNDSTDCTACHTHGGGFVDHLASVSVPAPHDAAACTACHTTPDTYVVDAAIPDAACLTCHDGVTATLVATHSSKACVECHNPMSTQTNLKFVRSTIAGSIVPGSPITFTATSGAGSFADGVPYTENVCETCHSATDHHQSDGTAPGNQDHNDSTDCTACHTHGGGFVDHLASVSVPAPHDAAACTACHTTPDTYVVDAAIPDAACLTCHDGTTATLVATHSSKACVECHNPMAVQTNLKFVRDTIAGSIVPGSPITFTATSGAGSFADGVPYTENVCETCHSATDHHQSDGTAPGNQDHNDSTDCTACHTHGGGFVDHLASVSVPVPHDAAACTDCHTTPDTYVVDAAIPDAACLTCHDGVTATLVATHSSKACVECHNPMSTQSNLKFVRSTIAGSIVPGSPITFTATSGAGSFADGVPYTENVCETCHSATDHHQSDGTAPGNQDHNDSTDCTACHTHGGGFSDHLASVSVPAPHDAAACTDCHTTPDTYVVDAAIPDAACLACHDGVTATLVATHSSKACVECHNPMSTQTNLKFVRSTIAGSIVPGSPITFTATSGAGSFADGVPYTENVCETCHSATDHHQSDGTAPGNQDHNDSTDCTACHTHGGGFVDHLASVSVPAPHDAAACTDCHTTPDTYVVDAAIPDTACLACHDGVTATLVATHSSKACVECHNPMATQTNLKFVRSTIAGSIVPGSPITFTATSGAGSFADGVPYTENVCETCHSATDHHQSDGTAPGNQDHNDSTDCTACHTHGGGFVDHLASVSVPVPHDAAACTDCHTTPDTYVVDAVIPDAACLTCHDGVTATLVATHNTKTCVDCHNPMAAQTNLKFVRDTIGGSSITYTATSGAGSFADGAPHAENVCETCHTMTNHHQADGTAPGGQDHENSVDCRVCHAHGDGFTPAPANVPAPHNLVACGDCHGGADYSTPILDAACLTCHDGVTATLVATHSSKACVECHNPMSTQTNLKFVRSTIAGSIVPGSPITFTATSGAGSFADGVPYTENVCETCHSATDHHQSDGTAPGNQAHNDSTDCTACHTHGGGFVDHLASVSVPAPHDAAACTDCHTTPDTYVVDAVIPDAACLTCHDGVTATLVATHSSKACVECHNPMSTQTNLKFVRSTIAGSIVPGSPITFTATSGAGSFADGVPYTENVCETCHSATDHHQSDGTAPGNQDHNDSTDCTACHTHGGGFVDHLASVSVPAPHDAAACTDCHTTPDTYVVDAAIPDAACLTCHDGVTATLVATHSSKACVECHNPMSTQTNLKFVRDTIAGSIVPGSPITFTATSGAGSFADGVPYTENVCETCHSATDHHQSDGTAPGNQDHNDSTDCTACHTHGGGFVDHLASVSVPAPHDAAACTDCHTTPDTYVVDAVIPDAACLTCHDGVTATLVATHSSKACVECHNPMSTQTNLKFVRSTIAGSIVPGSPITFTATSGAGSFADGVPYTENVCETCHSATDHHQSDGTAPGNQDHNDSTDCTACHTHGGGFVDHLASVSVPAPHDAAACTDCHTTPDTYVVDAAIPDAACLACHDGVTATLVATHSSKACVECHNPMSTQSNLKFVRSTIAGSIVPGSPITFTATSGAGSFADGVPYTENVCETCHSATDHHQSDGTAPGNQAHNDSTDCTACHTHGGGFVDHLASVSVPAPHDAAACTACHTTPDTYVVDAAIPDAACLTCHDGVTATLVATHSSKACVECHNPMSTQSNLKFVRSTIAGSIVPGSPITFTATSGAGSFADGVPYTENVCETCHSATDHHQSDGTAPGNQDHNDSTDCTACHTHGGGFVDHLASVSVPAPHDVAACTACHTTPDTYVVDAVIPDAACLTCHDGVTATLVATHSSKACVECHNPMATQTNLKFVRSTIAGSIVPGSPITFTATSGAGSFADGVPYTENVCETCHSATDHHQSDGTAPGNQAHNDSTDCTACHTHGGGFVDHLASVSVPAPHDAAACTACHTTPDTYVVDAAIPDAACLACHDGVTATLVATHSSKACVECHNPMATQTNLKFVRDTIAGSIVPGSPITFTATSGAGSFADGVPYTENVCETCHSATDHHQSDGTAPGNQAHNDSTDCTACHTHGGGFVDHLASVSVPAPHDAAACTACHTTPDTYVVDAAIPDAACLTCHDGVTATLVATHSSKACVECHNPMSTQTNLKFVRDTIAGSIVPGSPITFTATSGAGSFADGVPYTENVCETCHSATDHHQSDGTAPGNQDHNDSTDCTACHTHGGGFSDHLASVSVPAPHDAAACTDCHTTPDTYVVDAAIPDAACLTCHDGVTATLVATHSSKACVECHNPMSTQTNLKFVRSTIAGSIVPGSPITFTATSGAGSFADGVPYTENVCETCHSATDHHQSDGTAPGNQDHNDSTDCTACHTHGGGFVDHLASVSVPAPHDAAACTACHTTPDTYVVDAAIPDAACLTCHDGVTATLVATHSSKACVECHNPMSTQTNLKFVRDTIAGSIVPGSPITFTATSGAGSFADGVPYTENVCETCHSATDHHQSDGTAPGNQDHNDSTNCTACHTHGGGFVDHLASVSVPAPHDVAACTACHTTPDTYVVDAAIPDAACLACHDGTTATLVATHSSKACVECHNPMAAQSNLKFVRDTIGGNAITYTATSGAGSFADGPPFAENVCETCHTMTNHHQVDGTAPGGQDHENSSDCRVCHAHGNGFSQAPAIVPAPHDVVACADCHGGAEYSQTIPDAQCEQCHTAGGALKGSYPAAPNVATHNTNACVDCHNPMTTQTNLKFVRDSIGGSTIEFTATTGAGSYADGVPYDENICETCHTATNYHQNDGTAPLGQNHNNEQDCIACHAHLVGFSPDLTPPPAPHNAFGCGWCHVDGDSYQVGAAIDNATCLLCHSGFATPVDSHHTPNFGDVDLDCVECHNPMREQINFRTNTNLKFVRKTIGTSNIAFEARTGDYSFAADASAVPDMDWENYVCNTCHTATDFHQNDGTATVSQAHMDGTDCMTCHAHNAGFILSDAAPPPHNTFICTVCHVTPDTYVFDAAIPSGACLNCHDPAQPGTAGGGSDKKVDMHTTPSYAGADPECVECHNPMRTQTNLSFIRTTIRGTNPIVFTAKTGVDSFADGPPYPENVCDTCHTQTDHHQADGTAPLGQSHNDSSNCSACHPHTAGFEPIGGCLSCHNQSPPAGSSDTNRRQIVEGTAGDGNGDFVRTSHHVVNGPVTSEVVTEDDCTVCHDQASHTTFGDGESVLLADQDGGPSYTYNGNPLTAEAFCLSCHDGNHPTPFPSDSNSPLNIENDWLGSSHEQSLSATCLDCHDKGHGSDFDKMLDRPNDANLCFECHDADGPSAMNMQAEFAKASAHNASRCQNCHNPHKATASNPINGVAGVDPSTPAAGGTPTYTLSTITNPDQQYQLCFTCHSDWNSGPMTGSNHAVLFNTNNDSYHWVENDKGASKATTSTMIFNSTYVGKMMPRYDGASDATLRGAKMRCSDCHGPEDADGGVSVPEGPHGSTSSPILKVPAGSPYTDWNATVTYNDNPGTVWCFNCHSADFTSSGYSNSGGESLHYSKSGHAKEPCQACHIAVPHGGTQRKRLLSPTRMDESVDSVPSGGWNGNGFHSSCRL